MRSKFSSILPLVGVLCILSIVSGEAVAQAVYGTISGAVQDDTGAIIPGAEVKIENVAKGASWIVLSDDSGNFRKERLLPGSGYRVTVAMEGFKTFIQENITVNVDAVIDVSVLLTVGEISDTITVTGAPPPLKTEKTDVAISFSEREVTELPIFERNFTRFLLLTPGTSKLAWNHASSENPQGSQQIMVNGQNFSGTGFQLDGTSNRDPILGIIVINPTLEGVTEAKVTSQNFDAEFGQATAGVVTAQTKSGTNSVHGSAFWFRRNDIFQARDPFSQSLALDESDPDKFIPDTIWNQFGGSIGGPIVKDKAFFFFDYQGTRRKQGGSILTTVPTAAARNGDLSEYVDTILENPSRAGFAIYDPATGNPDGTGRLPFENGIIPENRLSPQALTLIGQLPLPNRDGISNNFSSSGIQPFDDDAFNTRIDWYKSDDLHLFGRYSFAEFSREGPGAFGELLGGPAFNGFNFAGASSSQNHSIASGFNYTLSDRVLTDFRFGFFRYKVDVLPGGLGSTPAQDAGVPNLNTVPGVQQDPIFTSGMPFFDIQGDGAFQFGYALGVNQCNCPLDQSEQQWQFVNNWIFTSGDHTFKFGADIRYAQNRRVPSDNHRAGELTFNVGRTSINRDDGGEQGGLGIASFLIGDVNRFRRFVSPTTDAEERQKRWFFYGQDTWKVNDRLTLNYGLRWEIYFPETVTEDGQGGFFEAATGQVRVAGIGGIGRNGDIENSFTNFAPRLGITWQVNDSSVLRLGYGRSFDLGVFGSTFGHAVTQNLPVLAQQDDNTNSFGDVFNLGQGPETPPFPEPDSNGRFQAPDGVQFFVRPEKMRLPTLDAWNVTFQQEIGRGVVWEVGYVGNKGTHVFAGDNPDHDFNQARIDPNGNVPDTFDARKPFFAGQIPGLGGPFGLTQSFRYFGNDADNNYHSLQAKIERRFSDGWSLLTHYTLARNFGYQNDYFIHDANLNYGPTSFHRTHQLVVNGLYELPVGRGRKLASDVSAFVDHLIGGWQFNTALTFASGMPFSPTHADCGSLRDTGPCRPNRIGEPDDNGDQFQWFSLGLGSVWEIPAVGTFGNELNNRLRGPGFFNADLSIFKNVALAESVNLQIRGEIFNVFNHTNLNQPNNCINCNPDEDGRIRGIAPQSNMRQVQWALRLQF